MARRELVEDWEALFAQACPMYIAFPSPTPKPPKPQNPKTPCGVGKEFKFELEDSRNGVQCTKERRALSSAEIHQLFQMVTLEWRHLRQGKCE